MGRWAHGRQWEWFGRTDNDLMAVAVPLLVSQGVSVGTYVCLGVCLGMPHSALLRLLAPFPPLAFCHWPTSKAGSFSVSTFFPPSSTTLEPTL